MQIFKSKNIIFAFLLTFGISFFANSVFAQKTEISFFYSQICPYCKAEKIFLEDLSKKYSEIEIKSLGVFEKENIEILGGFYEKYQVPKEKRGFVPITFIRDRYFLGFSDEIGKEIENFILGIETKEALPSEVKIPFLGKINVSKFSPLALAVILGTVDGFNACAMTALVFLLAVLIASGIRKRIFLIGGTFILVSGIVYFLFISAWLNLFACLANVKFITGFVGLIVIIFAIFLLKDYFHGIVCKICEIKPGKESIFVRIERKLFKKMERLSSKEIFLPTALLGIAVVAAGVNMVELCCSFGFPLVFTKILTSWNLSSLSYYFYILIYILFYMLDDFIIFLVAILTLRITSVSQRYLKTIKLISGILLLLLGLIMLIKPSILMLG